MAQQEPKSGRRLESPIMIFEDGRAKILVGEELEDSLNRETTLCSLLMGHGGEGPLGDLPWTPISDVKITI